MSPDRPMTDLLRDEQDIDFAALDTGPRTIHAHVMRPIMRQLNQALAHTVLDLGCGNGWFTHALERCGFEAVGVDHDSVKLAAARLLYPHMRFETLDATQLRDSRLTNRFDAVVAIDVIDHVAAPRAFIEFALDALKPGGLLVVTAPYYGYIKNIALALTGRFDARWDPLMESGRIKFFSRATLTALLAEYELAGLHFETVGRVPMLARAMVLSGTHTG